MSSTKTAPAKEQAAEKKEPANVFSAYTGGSRLELTVWRNANGEQVNYAVSISRSYKDGEEWKTTKSLRQQDLPHVSFLAQQAYTWIGEQED